jgi:DNA-binding response OmpR family regulator
VDAILLIAADRRFRTLVRAQLLEEGFEVSAWPSLEYALAHLLRGGEPPQLIILDAEGIEIKARVVADVWQLTGQAPLLLCAGVYSRAELDREGFPPARVLLRPFRVEDVAQEVRKVLGRSEREHTAQSEHAAK